MYCLWIQLYLRKNLKTLNRPGYNDTGRFRGVGNNQSAFQLYLCWGQCEQSRGDSILKPVIHLKDRM